MHILNLLGTLAMFVAVFWASTIMFKQTRELNLYSDGTCRFRLRLWYWRATTALAFLGSLLILAGFFRELLGLKDY